MDRKESPVGVIASWAALVASFVLSFATWVGLAELAGFTGEAHGIHLSWFLAVAVDGYVVSALVTWMAPVSEEIARFAKVNTYAGATVGVIAQSAYHGLSADTTHGQWVPYLAAVVGALPPLAAGLSVHLRALVRRAHLSGTVRTDTAKPDTVEVVRTPEPVVLSVDTATDTAKAVRVVHMSKADVDTRTLHALVPAAADMDKIPAPRRVRPDAGWKIRARELIAAGLTDREVMEKISADHPDLWNTPEAGRKAVSRLR